MTAPEDNATFAASDFRTTHGSVVLAAAHTDSPHCQSALTVIESVLAQLRQEYTDAGKTHLFEAIHSSMEEDGAQTCAEIAAKLNVTEGAVKMAVLRLRENFRHRLRSEIAQTVANTGEIDEELRHLFACLGR
jgi:hypothetical protein